MNGKTGVFICPSCQAVVRSEKPLSEGFICEECSHEFGKVSSSSKGKTQIPGGSWEKGSGGVIRDLTAKKSAPILPVVVTNGPKITVKTLEQAREASVGSTGEEEMIMSDGSRTVRRRKKREKKEKNKGLLLFLGGWLCVVISVFVIFNVGKIGDSNIPNSVDNNSGPNLVDRQIITSSSPKIRKDFQLFVQLPPSGGQGQFIDRSADLSLPFSRYYQNNIFPKPESQLKAIGWNVLHLPDDGVGVESIWQDDDGHRWGALHILDKETSTWKLDWENFAPYSTQSWSEFRDELGSKEGVFRLLVRKRRTLGKKSISLSFYRAPGVFEKNDEFKSTESPELDFLTGSDLAQEFLSLWNNHQKEIDPMGSMLGRFLDPFPKTFMRITVRLGWEKNERGESVMDLKEIIGPGWFGERIIKLRENAKDTTIEEALKKPSELSDSE